MQFAHTDFRIYKYHNLGLDTCVKRKGNVPWIMLLVTVLLFIYSVPLLLQDKPAAFKIGALLPTLLLGLGTAVIWFMRASMAKPRREVPPPMPKDLAGRK